MKSAEYAPENANEEFFELVGRLKAFAAYVNTVEYAVPRDLCANMLGFELKRKDGDK